MKAKFQPKDKKNNKNLPKEKGVGVTVGLGETPAAPAHHELDPEILEALNVRKKKKNQNHEIDYIPELERGETVDIDSDL